MINSFLGTNVGRIVFTIWWVVLAIVHFIILAIFYSIPLNFAIADSLINTVLFTLHSFGLWFWVRFSDIETTKPLTLIVNHLGAIALSIAVIITVMNFLLSQIFSEEMEYLVFLEESLIGRVIYGTLIYILVTLAFYLIIYIQNYREKVMREAELKALVKDAELNWLKLQLNPHFLFNSLNSVSSLTMTQPDKAQEMIIRLSELLRYSLKQKPDSLVSLEKELDNCIKYLEIEKVRFGSRLNYSIDCTPACLSVDVPGMILQPLFENAIKYSVAQSIGQSDIKAGIDRVTDGIEIRISNSLPPEPITHDGAGVGLENIRRRLLLMYGRSNLITVSRSGDFFNVIIFIPDRLA